LKGGGRALYILVTGRFSFFASACGSVLSNSSRDFEAAMAGFLSLCHFRDLWEEISFFGSACGSPFSDLSGDFEAGLWISGRRSPRDDSQSGEFHTI
jgi:hypothetical protein